MNEKNTVDPLPLRHHLRSYFLLLYPHIKQHWLTIVGFFMYFGLLVAGFIATSYGIEESIGVLFGPFGKKPIGSVLYGTSHPFFFLAFFIIGSLMVIIGTIGMINRASFFGKSIFFKVHHTLLTQLLYRERWFFLNQPPQKVIDLLDKGFFVFEELIAYHGPRLLAWITIALVAWVMMLCWSVFLTLTISFSLPIFFVAATIMRRITQRIRDDAKDHDQQLISYRNDILTAVYCLQCFNYEGMACQILNQMQKKNSSLWSHFFLIRSLVHGAMIALGIGGLVTFVLLIREQGGIGILSMEQCWYFLGYSFVFVAAILTITRHWRRITQDVLIVRILVDLSSYAPLVPHIAQQKRSLPSHGRGILGIHHLHFSYPHCPSIFVLDDLTLAIPPKQMVALVGLDYQSTDALFSLLLRFLIPQKGHLYLDGVDYVYLDAATIRRQIGLLKTPLIIPSQSLWYNLTYGNPGASIEQVEWVLEKVGLLDWANRLHHGYNTILAKNDTSQDTTILSADQACLISIAQYLLVGPSIILVDEEQFLTGITTPKVLQGPLEAMMNQRTCLVATNHLGTILKANQVAFFEKGRIAAYGHHHELLETCPSYRRRHHLQ